MGWGLWTVIRTVRVGNCDSKDEDARKIGVERESLRVSHVVKMAGFNSRR